MKKETVKKAKESKKNLKSAGAKKKGSDQSQVKNYYEAESWQFSGCGD